MHRAWACFPVLACSAAGHSRFAARSTTRRSSSAGRAAAAAPGPVGTSGEPASGRVSQLIALDIYSKVGPAGVQGVSRVQIRITVARTTRAAAVSSMFAVTRISLDACGGEPRRGVRPLGPCGAAAGRSQGARSRKGRALLASSTTPMITPRR